MRRNHARPLLIALFLVVASSALASTTWYVDGVNGSDSNNCMSSQTACKTIGHAISLASSGDSIMVAAATYTENLSIGFSLSIFGSGAKTTIIDGGRVNTVVTISANAHVALSKVTVSNGLAQYGGGISNAGTLTINNSTLSGNEASSGLIAKGGGIFNNGTLTINNSTLSNNGASTTGGLSFPDGGGIFNNGGALTINNSTLSGNRAAVTAGGVLNEGTLSISSSTLSGNKASSVGGGIRNNGSATVQNSIVANNSGGNCYLGMTSNGYNLSSDNTCNFNSIGDLNNTNPKLGALRNNGGPTQTQALRSGSPAIDAGNPSGCTDGQGRLLTTDQRGQPRPDKEDSGGCDMGAYERKKD